MSKSLYQAIERIEFKTSSKTKGKLMKLKLIPLLFLALLFAIPTACQGEKPKTMSGPSAVVASTPEKVPAPTTPPAASQPASPTTGPASDEADAKKWVEGMASVLPNIFCKDGSYFRECFKITAQECEAEAIRVTRVCLQSREAEIQTNLKKDGGQKWGEKVGECAGGSYELSLKDKRIDNAKCNDPTKWM